MLLRIISLAGNAALLAWIVYGVGTEPGYVRHKWWEYLIGYGLVSFLVLNLVYLLLGNQPTNWRIPNWRVFRLIGLWFDAKESELRQRADRSRQGK